MEDGSYSGFMNENGNIVIPASFMPIYGCKKYKSIIPFIDSSCKNMKNNRCLIDAGFILKDGTILHYKPYGNADLNLDCESDFLIRYFDGYGKIGYLDTKGNVAIPSEYSMATPMVNGIAFVKKDDGFSQQPSSKFSVQWPVSNFNADIINQKGEIIAHNVNYSPFLLLYSLREEKKCMETLERDCFELNNKRIISFIRLDREFTEFFKKNFMLNYKFIIENKKELIINDIKHNDEYLRKKDFTILYQDFEKAAKGFESLYLYDYYDVRRIYDELTDPYNNIVFPDIQPPYPIICGRIMFSNDKYSSKYCFIRENSNYNIVGIFN